VNFNTNAIQTNLASYETKLKCFMLPMSSMFCCKYNKNYNIRMFIEKVVIMNKVFFSLSNGCHINLVVVSHTDIVMAGNLNF